MDKNGYSYIMMKNVAYKTYFDVRLWMTMKIY